MWCDAARLCARPFICKLYCSSNTSREADDQLSPPTSTLRTVKRRGSNPDDLTATSRCRLKPISIFLGIFESTSRILFSSRIGGAAPPSLDEHAGHQLSFRTSAEQHPRHLFSTTELCRTYFVILCKIASDDQQPCEKDYDNAQDQHNSCNTEAELSEVC